MLHAPDVGDVAPELEGPTVDGAWFRLFDHRDRPVIVSFLRHAG